MKRRFTPRAKGSLHTYESMKDGGVEEKLVREECKGGRGTSSQIRLFSRQRAQGLASSHYKRVKGRQVDETEWFTVRPPTVHGPHGVCRRRKVGSGWLPPR